MLDVLGISHGARDWANAKLRRQVGQTLSGHGWMAPDRPLEAWDHARRWIAPGIFLLGIPSAPCPQHLPPRIPALQHEPGVGIIAGQGFA